MVRITSEGLEYEADPGHTELITGSLGFTAANAVKTPGVKDPVPDYSITKSDNLPTTTMGDYGSNDMGVSACCAIMGRQQGISKQNHDDTDADTTSSPHCHAEDDMDIGLSDTDAMTVDYEVPRTRMQFSHSETFDIKPYSEIYGKYIPLDLSLAKTIGNT